MSRIGQLLPPPSAGPMNLPARGRVISLYPDRQQVWGHRIYRMPPPYQEQGIVYGADAGLREENPTGRLIDLYA